MRLELVANFKRKAGNAVKVDVAGYRLLFVMLLPQNLTLLACDISLVLDLYFDLFRLGTGGEPGAAIRRLRCKAFSSTTHKKRWGA